MSEQNNEPGREVLTSGNEQSPADLPEIDQEPFESLMAALQQRQKPTRPEDAEPAADIQVAIDEAGKPVLELIKRIEVYLDQKVALQNFLEGENQAGHEEEVPYLESTQTLIDSKASAVLSTAVANLITGFELLRRAVAIRPGI